LFHNEKTKTAPSERYSGVWKFLLSHPSYVSHLKEMLSEAIFRASDKFTMDVLRRQKQVCFILLIYLFVYFMEFCLFWLYLFICSFQLFRLLLILFYFIYRSIYLLLQTSAEQINEAEIRLQRAQFENKMTQQSKRTSGLRKMQISEREKMTKTMKSLFSKQ
jgi:hypothetical protein